VKLIVVSKAHDVTQQTRLVNLRTGVADAHTAPIRLARDQAIAFEQIAGQGFSGGRFVEIGRQQLGIGLVLVALQIQTVKTETIQLMHRLAVKALGQHQLHTHTRFDGFAMPNARAQVLTQTRLQLGHIVDARVVETVQVQLERFALNDVRGLCRHGDACQSHLGLTACVEPAQLIRRPQVSTKKWRLCGDTNFVAFGLARNGKQQ
jgi:hypothetical protein